MFNKLSRKCTQLPHLEKRQQWNLETTNVLIRESNVASFGSFRLAICAKPESVLSLQQGKWVSHPGGGATGRLFVHVGKLVKRKWKFG